MNKTEERLEKLEEQIRWLNIDANLNQNFREHSRRKVIEDIELETLKRERSIGFWWGMCTGAVVMWATLIIVKVVFAL